MRDDIGYDTGNVVGDRRLPGLSVAQMKADAALAIASALHERDLSIEQAATIVGLEPGQLRGIVSRGRVDGLSLEQLGLAIERLERRGRTS
ncbi:hypothetical protein [Pseudaminobacter sp. NGMCC 1.201702]|uniref:hypothetical protein n=1 Tax=Pseudaminobacter sp. NGMCC 1.201702 TaxID=3391825 RepID=UPI0039EFF331